MPDVHVTFELLAAVDRGELTVEQALTLYTEHLRALCPVCDVQIQAFLDAGREEAAPGAAADPALEGLPEETRADLATYAPPVRRFILRAVRELQEGIDAETPAVTRQHRELLRAVDAGRGEEARARVERARTRFRSPMLGFWLLRDARASLPDRPRRALDLAALAEGVALRMPDPRRLLGTVRGALGGLALAHQGNALRVLDRLREADRRFARARWLLDEWGVTDPATLGEVDALEGSLRRDHRRFRARRRRWKTRGGSLRNRSRVTVKACPDPTA